MSRTELPAADAERCETCRYWQEDEEDNGYRTGYCCRYPPLPDVGFLRSLSSRQEVSPWEQWGHPVTIFNSWCGEYQAKPAPPQSSGQSIDAGS